METVLGTTFSALKHTNYRYYWIGQCISAIGTTMQSAALAWLVYTLTGSPVLLATLAVFQFGPLLVLALPAGVYVDRWPKRRVILVTQTLFALQALALAVLVFSGRATYQTIIALAAFYGVVQAFDNPCRRAFLVDLVGKPDLMNAVSLNSAVFSLARIVGPTIAGIALARLGGGWCFLLNALSYGAVIIALLKVTVDGEPTSIGAESHLGAEIAAGLRYIWRTDALRTTMSLALVLMIFGLNENVIIPVFADRALHMGSEAYGLLLSALGVGALLGATAGAAIGRRATPGRLIIMSGLAIGVIQLIAAATRSLGLVAAEMAVLGAVSVLFANASASTVQTSAEPQLRGRVMSVYALVEMGTLPVGNAFAGAVMAAWGAPMGFLLGGGVSIILLLTIAALQWGVIQRSLFKRA